MFFNHPLATLARERVVKISSKKPIFQLFSVYFDHEKLDVYQAAIELVILIDEIVYHFPRGGSYLADQLQRAGSSVPLNIAKELENIRYKKKADFIEWQNGLRQNAQAFLT